MVSKLSPKETIMAAFAVATFVFLGYVFGSTRSSFPISVFEPNSENSGYSTPLPGASLPPNALQNEQSSVPPYLPESISPTQPSEPQPAPFEMPRKPWPIYTNAEFGISFEYPRGWTVKVDRDSAESGGGVYISVFPPTKTERPAVSIGRYPESSPTLQAYADKLQSCVATPDDNGMGCPLYMFGKIETQNSIAFLPGHYWGEGGDQWTYDTLHDGSAFRFSEYDFDVPLPIFDVVKSFKFAR